MSTSEHLRKFYNESDYGTWSDSTGLLEEEERLFQRHPLPESNETRILDMGTGGGRMIFGLHSRGYRRLTGIDLSERMIAAASARAEKLGVEATFEVQDVANLPYPDGSFDVIIGLAQILCHVERAADRRRALARIHRLLAPGGLFYLSVLSWEGRGTNPLIALAAAPFKVLKGDWYALSRYHLPLLKVAGRLNVQFAWKKQPYLVFFTRELFQRELKEAGFELVVEASARMLADGTQEFAPGGGYLFGVARKV